MNIKENWLKILIIALGSLITLSFVYYLVVIPTIRENRIKEENQRQEFNRFEEQKRQEEISNENESSRRLCLIVAEEKYDTDFELNSSDHGDYRIWDNANVRDNVERNFQTEKDFCLKRFPLN